MRKTSERSEGIEQGCAKLIGNDKNRIIEEATRLIQDETLLDSMKLGFNPYGDGNASERILKEILKFFKL